MPFPHARGDGVPDCGLSHLGDGTDTAGNEAVEEAIFEAGEERWGEVVAREEEVRRTFAYNKLVGLLWGSKSRELTLAVNQDARVAAIST